jgi:hypothetical protein
MIHLRVRAADTKHVRITGIDPFLARCLGELPDLIQRANTECLGRLYPDPTTDPNINADWQQYVTPDLHHLFVAAGQTVEQDLTGLGPDTKVRDHFQVTLPAAHLKAWISALNQARLHLGDHHDVTEADMNSREFDLDIPKRNAVFQIHIFGYLLQLLLELEDGSANAR